MPQIIDITNPPEDLDILLEQAMPEVEALDKKQMVRRLASRERVLQLSDIMLVSWSELAHLIDEHLKEPIAEQRKAELKRLDTRAWTFLAADLAAEEIHSNTARKQRDALAKRIKGHDKFLFKWALAFFGDDPGHAETLRDIARGSGRRDDAEDVLRLVSLYNGNPDAWVEITDKDHDKKLDKTYLKGAHADATKQLDYLRSGAANNPARVVADAVYTLWYLDYDELMHLGRYLTRRQSDSMERFPGVRELPSYQAAAPINDEPDEPVEEEGDDEDDEDDNADENAENGDA